VARTVRLVDVNGEQLGVVTTTEALKIAREKNFWFLQPPILRWQG